MEVNTIPLEELGFETLTPENLLQLTTCTICSQTLTYPITTACGRSYCRDCISSSVTDDTSIITCPEDNCMTYTQRSCPVDITLQEVVQKLVALLYSDVMVQDQLHNIVATTLEADPVMICSVCLHRFLAPTTTKCGHTFCENCLRSVVESAQIDEGVYCPLCRTVMVWPYEDGLVDHHDASKFWNYNKHLASLISTCWKPWVLERQDVISKDENLWPDDMNNAIFVCTPAFPGQVTILRIFEPRYRRMLRRVMNSESQTFVMMAKQPNRSGLSAQIGTLMKITGIYHQPPQMIIIKTIGVSRFRIEAGARLYDGYWTARTVPLFDDAEAVDWDWKAKEPSVEQLHQLMRYGFQPRKANLLAAIKLYKEDNNLVQCLSNLQIMETIRSYVDLRLENQNERAKRLVFREIGSPPQDNIEMLWWFAHVVGSYHEVWSVEMLASTSVRYRLENALWYIVNHIPNHHAALWNV